MRYNDSSNAKHLPSEYNANLCEEQLVNILDKSKLFPLSFEKLYKQISKEINTQKRKTVEQTIQKLVFDGVIVTIESERGNIYISQQNEKNVLANLNIILQDYHKQFPYKAGVTKSHVREFFF